MILISSPSPEEKPLDYIRARPELIFAFYEAITEAKAGTRSRLTRVTFPLYRAISEHVDIHEYLARRLSPDEFRLSLSDGPREFPNSHGGQLRHVRYEPDGSITQIIIRNGRFIDGLVHINPLGPCGQEFIDDQGTEVTGNLFEDHEDLSIIPKLQNRRTYKQLIVLIEQKSVPLPTGECTIVESFYLVHPTGYPTKKTIKYSDHIKIEPSTEFSVIERSVDETVIEIDPEIEELDGGEYGGEDS